MNGVQDFNRIIDEIESNILDPDVITMASEKSAMSIYEFRRIFSFMVGMPVGEYIRLRKLSKACMDIRDGCTVKDVSEKYGYTSVYSFSRAFKLFFGFPPSRTNANPGHIKLLTKPIFNFSISNTEIVEFGVEDDGDFFVDGISGISDLSDTECCEKIWQKFYDADIPMIGENVYAVYDNDDDDGSVKCTIGFRNGKKGQTRVEKHKWMTFILNTVDDKAVNNFYQSIYFDYLPSAGYVRDTGSPIVEVFPKNMDEDGFLWQIRIPIIKGGKADG